MTSNNWRSLVTFIAGGWLLLSPWIMDYHQLGAAAWSAATVGTVLILCEFMAFVRPGAWEELLDLMLGGYLVASPVLLGFSESLAVADNAGMVGTVVVGLAVIGLFDEPEAQRWWHNHMHHPS